MRKIVLYFLILSFSFCCEKIIFADDKSFLTEKLLQAKNPVNSKNKNNDFLDSDKHLLPNGLLSDKNNFNLHKIIHLSSFSQENSTHFPSDTDLGGFTKKIDSPKEINSEHENRAVFENKEVLDEMIDLNFENTTISSLIKIIADKMGIAYVLSKDLDTVKVPPLKTYGKRTLAQAWDFILSLLRDGGFSHEDRDGLHIFSKDGLLYPIYSSKDVPPDKLEDSEQVIRYLLHLSNLKADMVSSFLGNFLTEKPMMVGSFDVLLLKEKSRNLKQILKIVQELDVGGIRQTVTILPLNYTNVETVAKFLNDDIVGQSRNSSDRIKFFSPLKRSVTYFPTDIKIVPYKEKNVLILFGQKPEIDRIVHFVKFAIDIKLEESRSRIHIREIKYQDPEYIKGILEQLLSNKANTSGNNDKFKDVIIHAESPDSGGGSSGKNGAGSRLIIACSEEEWRLINDLVDDLDKASQTLAIEVMVVDASMDLLKSLASHVRDDKDGFINSNISFRTNTFAEKIDLNGQTVNPREYPLNKAIIAQDSTAFAFGKTGSGILDQDAWSVIRTTATQNNSAIIYQPFLTVKSNESVSWTQSETQQVGGELQNSGGKIVRRQTQARATTSLTISPRVNQSGLVDLSITINVEEFLQKVGGSVDQPESGSRSVKTRATVGMGEVLALGGFDKSKMTKSNTNIPLLSRFPIIGNFFRTSSKQSTKTQTMFFVRTSTMKQELQPDIDDYTALKIKYAKYQIGNIDSYAESQDPFFRVFFKPRNSTIKQTNKDFENSRFKYIDDFVERKNFPQAVNIKNDPSFNSGLTSEIPPKFISYWDKVEPDGSPSEQKKVKTKNSEKKQEVLLVESLQIQDANSAQENLLKAPQSSVFYKKKFQRSS